MDQPGLKTGIQLIAKLGHGGVLSITKLVIPTTRNATLI